MKLVEERKSSHNWLSGGNSEEINVSRSDAESKISFSYKRKMK